MNQPNFDLNNFLPYQLARSAAQVSRDFARLYAEKFGISTSEWRVIAHLGQSEAVSVREIHTRVDMDKPKVSRAAARLEEAGYVAKTTSTTDKRLVELTLTDKGRELYAEMIPIARQYEDELLEKLGATNKKLLTTLLDRLTEPDP